MQRSTPARSVRLASVITLCLLAAPLSATAETKQLKPGFNLFTVEQDVEIGKQSAAQAERQLPLLNNRSVDRYLNKVVSRLAKEAPGADYPYQIKAVNAPEINAFALPGGPMYVNRGLFEAARTEAELAGVLAHEMAHVALRHGTHQASKAYLGQAGLGILGGLIGKKSANTSQMINAIGGVGLNVAFLKFSRDAEYQADAMGAAIMAKAGYDPMAMANFFELLRTTQGRDPGKVERFFSDHPSAADREDRIRDVARELGDVRDREVGGFQGQQAGLRRLSPPSSQQVQLREIPSGDYGRDTQQIALRVERPSSRYQRFDQRNGLFTIEHPENWQAYASDGGFAVSMAPAGGVVETSNGRQAMLYGVIVNHYSPFEGETDRQTASMQHSYAPFEDRDQRRGNLEDATDDLVRQVLRTNSYLDAADGSAQSERIDGAPAYSLLLSGRSPVTGEEERVMVHTRLLPDGDVVYALCIVPGREYDAMSGTFSHMMRTLRIDDSAVHGSADSDRYRSNLRPATRAR